MIKHALSVAAAAALLGSGGAQALTLYGPSPYLSYADSPFFGDATIVLEDFEGAATPGYTGAAPGSVISGSLVDSVENGTSGRSWYSDGSNTITFAFTSVNLPTRAGIVWTDVGFTGTPPDGFGDVKFEVYDALGALAGGNGGSGLGDGAFAGGKSEDRFFGAYLAGGISKIVITMPDSTDWEVDHLQFGAPVPEPGTWALMGVGLLAVGASVARKRRR